MLTGCPVPWGLDFIKPHVPVAGPGVGSKEDSWLRITLKPRSFCLSGSDIPPFFCLLVGVSLWKGPGDTGRQQCHLHQHTLDGTHPMGPGLAQPLPGDAPSSAGWKLTPPRFLLGPGCPFLQYLLKDFCCPGVPFFSGQRLQSTEWVPRSHIWPACLATTSDPSQVGFSLLAIRSQI